MEVTIKNAFFIIAVITWKSCVSNMENTFTTLQFYMHTLIGISLEYPLATTFFITTWLMIILLLLSMSFLILTGVACALAVIIISEGFLCFTLLLFTGLVSYCVLLTLATMYGIQSLLRRDEQQINI